MKYIFLDFDGVINSTKYLNSKQFRDETQGLSDAEVYLVYYKYMIDPEAIKLINGLVARSGAQVIASTSHRIKHSIEELNNMMASRGATFKFSGKTPRLYKERGIEIQTFLDSLPEPPESFVILDDHFDMLHLKDHLVLTVAEVGIKPNQVEKALKILNGDLS